MRTKIFIVKVVLAIIFFVGLTATQSSVNGQNQSIYDFKIETIDGQEFDMASLKGKKVMIVNVASKCGYTRQYETLQELYDMYKDDGFVILGFPANNFANQEAGTNEEIAQFCKANFGVEFTMMSKISVRGDDIAPLYKWLTHKLMNGKSDYEVTWNFNKFLINADGTIEAKYESKVEPNDIKILEWIEK